jgi:hypothetical protein
MIGTLTCILKFMHTLISLIFPLYVVFRSQTEPLLLENHVHIVALTPNLQRVFFSVTYFLYYSSTTELILSLIL